MAEGNRWHTLAGTLLAAALVLVLLIQAAVAQTEPATQDEQTVSQTNSPPPPPPKPVEPEPEPEPDAIKEPEPEQVVEVEPEPEPEPEPIDTTEIAREQAQAALLPFTEDIADLVDKDLLEQVARSVGQVVQRCRQVIGHGAPTGCQCSVRSAATAR